MKDYLRYIEQEGGSISIEHFEYFCRYNGLDILKHLQDTLFVVKCEMGYISLTEKGKKALTSPEIGGIIKHTKKEEKKNDNIK